MTAAPKTNPGGWRPWTPDELERLTQLLGRLPPHRVYAAFPERTSRAIDHAVYERLRLSYRVGAVSLFKLRKETGYDWRQLLHAKAALGQKWARGKPTGRLNRWGKPAGTRHLITREQARALVAYLATEKAPSKRWARDQDACAACGKSDRPHAGSGLCGPCYQRSRYARRSVPCPKCGARPLTLLRLKSRARSRRHHDIARIAAKGASHA